MNNVIALTFVTAGIALSARAQGIVCECGQRLKCMKNKLSHPLVLLFGALVIGLFVGCAATRPIGDVALGAGGAYLGHELSDGNPIATAAGAAGGVVLSEGLHYAARKQSDKAYSAGYDKGKSDAVKHQYWLYVSMQKQRNQVGAVRLYPVQLPEQRVDGVIFQPSTKYLRIEE